MSLFRYVAVDPDDRVRHAGELAAPSAAAVRSRLREAGLEVLSVRPADRRLPAARETGDSPAPTAPLRDLLNRRARRRRLVQRAELFDGLAILLAAGVPLVRALEATAGGDATSTAMRRLLQLLAAALRDGGALSQALSQHESWFDEVDVQMVAAGEEAGTLPEVLTTLAETRQESEDLSQQVLGALLYPLVIAVVGIAVAVFLSVRTLPALAGILEQNGVELPALTRSVMSVGQAVARYTWLALPLTGLAAVLPAVVRAAGVSSPSISLGRLPVLVHARQARLMSLLASLLRVGIPFITALRIVARTMPVSLRPAIERAAARIEGGASAPDALLEHRIIGAETYALLGVGQDSGELPAMLAKAAEKLQRRTQRSIKRVTTLLEPAVILALSALIGLVVMATILPLLRLQEIIG